jgi:single-stranded DNA-binding protein
MKIAETNEPESKKRSKKVSEKDLNLPEPTNEVFLRGRVSSTSEERELPSGDKVVEFRLVIGRSNSESKKTSKRKQVDTLDMAAWSYKSRYAALKLQVDDWVEIRGSVRRRFWQAPSGLASRWQVEVLQITRI